ncbi:MAG: DUF4388 domain-containing protein [Ardenticatenaceae bacterium]|nr:DUF4388 domain-containing protein [Ardenticatenaceae bacterium]
MAFIGHTKDFSAIQILNLIRLALRTGKLTFSGTYPVILFFSEGQLIYAQTDANDRDLLDVLLESGKLNAAQIGRIRQEAADVEAAWLSVWLLEEAYITKAELAQAYYRQVLETVYATVLHADGEFVFEDGLLPSLSVPVTAVDLREVIDEGDHLKQQWGFVQLAVPTLEICLQPTNQLTPAAGRMLLTKLEWQFASNCHPRRSAQQIAQILNLDNYRARRIVHNLLKLEMVKVVSSPPPPPPDTTELLPPPKFEATLHSLRANLQQNLVPSW